MDRVTISELMNDLSIKEKAFELVKSDRNNIRERCKILEKQLKDKAKEYVMIEIAERNFCIGKLVVGDHDKYSFVCTCRNRCQAERLLHVLNRGEIDDRSSDQ